MYCEIETMAALAIRRGIATVAGEAKPTGVRWRSYWKKPEISRHHKCRRMLRSM
jgi:hypothetical protein